MANRELSIKPKELVDGGAIADGEVNLNHLHPALFKEISLVRSHGHEGVISKKVRTSSLETGLVIDGQDNYMVLGNLLLQWGYGSLTGTAARNKTGTLTFPVSYSTVPTNIQLTFRGSGASYPPTTTDKFAIAYPDTPATDGFRIVIFCTDAADVLTNNVKYWVNWFVIGVK